MLGIIRGLLVAACLIVLAGAAIGSPRGRASAIRVVVWDERQPAQKAAYDNFLGNELAERLRHMGDGHQVTVKSVGLDDPDQGLSKETLDDCDVLIWWGHQRHG